MKDLFRILAWLGPYKRRVGVALGATLVNVAVSILVPLQTARIVDEGIALSDSGLVATTTVRMLLLVISGVTLSAVAAVVAVRVAFNVAADLRRDVHNHIQELSFANLDDLGTGEMLTRLTSDVMKVQMIIMFGLSFLAQAPLMLIGAVIAMLTLRADLTLILVVIVPIVVTVTWVITVRSRKLYTLMQSRLDRLNTVLRENLVGARVVRAFVRGEQEGERFQQVNGDLTARAIEVNQLVALLLPALIGIMNIGTAAIVWLGGNAVIGGGLLEGELLAFINYLLMASMPLIIFAMVQPLLAAGAASSTRIIEVLDTRAVVRDQSTPAHLGTQRVAGQITFEGVSFAYGEGDDILRDISLVIQSGTTLAVLGATGSGKSTLIGMIPRFHDPTSGTVSIDGVDVATLGQSELRRHIGISLQRATLFSGTVAENISYGVPDATASQIRTAARIAQADDFITALADGYESHVEAGGTNFSGGQRQRLAIARAVLGDPPILILDDSTSAVDVATEARIQAALGATGHARTTVIVAQRISTALAADQIVVLEDGRIVAHGPHEDLIASSTTYQEIYRSQLGDPLESMSA
ncbi:MAG: ABC transporter ATP-binding protein [Euzebya sp.]